MMNQTNRKARRAAQRKAKKLAKVVNAQTNSFERVQYVSDEKKRAWLSAVLSNTVHLLERKQCEPLSLPSIAVSMNDFLEANDNSASMKFNRTFYKDKFVKEVARKNKISISEAMNLKLICTPAMTHHYRSMSECETHYRCSVVYSAKNDSASFDMTISDYERLLNDAPDDHVRQIAA